MTFTKILGASAIAMGAALASTPAAAQQVCTVAGVPSGTATGSPSLACGSGANASGGYSTSIGQNSVASGQYSTAVGNYARATGEDATAVGVNSLASDFGTAFGFSARSTAPASTAIGNNATATAAYATAVGYYATATGVHSTAVGEYARATGTDSVAIGYHANTGTFTNSVALGTNTTATANNQVNVGGRTIGGVAAGVAATDAVNVAQLNAATGALNSSITGLTTDVGTLFDLRNADRRDMRKGIAAAVAMPDAPMPSQPGRVAYSVQGGTFRGQYAAGISLNYRLPTAAPVAINVGASFAGDKNNAAKVGVSGEF